MKKFENKITGAVYTVNTPSMIDVFESDPNYREYKPNNSKPASNDGNNIQNYKENKPKNNKKKNKSVASVDTNDTTSNATPVVDSNKIKKTV